MFIKIKITFVLLLLLQSLALIAQNISTEVCVYGGTAAGVMASIAVAREGKQVVLVAPERHVGGMSVEGLGGSDINNHADFKNHQAIGGLALEFYHRIATYYGRVINDSAKLSADFWRFESSVAERIIDSMLQENQVTVYRGERIREVNPLVKKQRRIHKIDTESGLNVSAKIFIDATIAGDLLAAAGVTTRVGREANREYGETKNGIRDQNTYRQFDVPVDPYRIPGDATSGVLPTIQDEPLGTPGDADHRIQAYCFRACLTKDSANRVPFTKPANYDAANYEIYLRYLQTGGKLYTPQEKLPHGKTDLGAWHDLSHNLYGMNHDYPTGNYITRQRIYQEHLDFTKGLFYFLANDARVPEKLRQTWSEWGTTKDEFPDNEGWPRQFYVREARRMVADYVITEHHTRADTLVEVTDPVAVAYWSPDMHHVRRIVRNRLAYNEGFVFGGDNWKPFGISYRAMIPKRTECTNLISPTCLSATHVAYGAIRLEWTFMALGQAAGLAAVMGLEEKVVQVVDYQMLRKRLLQVKQVISLD